MTHAFNSQSLTTLAKRWFWLFCVLHVVVWTLIPTLTRDNPPFDSVEGVAWGNQWQWGYDKHPFLAPWITAFTVRVFHAVDWSIYFLGAFSIAIAFVAIWKLASKCLPPLHALCAVMILEGIYYHNIAASQFNPNVLMVPLWALTIWQFYQAVTNKKIIHWLMVGFLAGLAVITKYESLILLAMMFLCLLVTAEGRRCFLKSGIYIGLLIFLLVIAPNFLWLYQHDFISLTYTLNRANSDSVTAVSPFFNHIYHPLSYLFEQVLALLPLLFLYLPFYRMPREQWQVNKFDKQFMLIIGLGPFISVGILSLITGMWVHSLWAFPFFTLMGILLMMWRRPEINPMVFKRFMVMFWIFFLVVAMARGLFLQYGPYWQHTTNSAQFPGKVISDDLTNRWHQQFHRPLKYVAGYRTLVEHISVYSYDHPIPYFEWSTKASGWVDENKMRQTGAVFVWFENNEGHKSVLPQDIAKRYPEAKPQPILIVPHLTGANIEPVRVGYAFLAPSR